MMPLEKTIMVTWVDSFTGITYRIADDHLSTVCQHIATVLADRLHSAIEANDAEKAANAAARFWREHYGWIFPLRFGLKIQNELLNAEELFLNDSEVDPGKGLRARALDQMKLPPLLPSGKSENELLSDHLLSTAALVNLLLRRRGLDTRNKNLLHQVRLALLIHELANEVNNASTGSLSKNFPQAWQIIQFLNGNTTAVPEGVDPNLLGAIHGGIGVNEDLVLVVGAVQRVKQYVFETPGLNEIRGASTLLDRLIDSVREQIGEEIGPEVVLRAAGATIEFLVPSEETAREWDHRIKRCFYENTGLAFISVGYAIAKVRELLSEFRTVSGRAYGALARDRAHADRPLFETLPFEGRCSICSSRAAEGWFWSPENRAEPVCRVCITKREVGRDERARKIERTLGLLRIDNPTALGVAGKNIEDSVADTIGLSETGEEGLIPSKLRRKLLGVIYGDGNNFGEVVQNLNSISMNLQWAHRVEKTTQAAAAIALACATQEAAKSRGWESNGSEPALNKIPFQVLALGGDDLSVLAWGRCALRFAERFVQLTDWEFRRGDEQNAKVKRPISFSLGVLLADEKTPVRRAVEFTEEELLKWAKRATHKHQQTAQGQVAFLTAITAEQIPTDLRSYRKTMYLKRGSGGNGSFELSLSLRPFSAGELGFLLKKAYGLINHSGSLQRMLSAFVQLGPMAAILHYLYQMAREKKKQGQFIEALEAGEWTGVFGDMPLPAKPLARLLFGEDEASERVWFSPLWDLMEIVKVLE